MADKDEQKKAEGGDKAATDAATNAGGGKKKILLIAGFVALLLVAAGVPTAFLLMRKPETTTEQLAADAASDEGDHSALVAEGGDDEELGEDEERLGGIAPLDTFVVNLSGGRYIRVQVQLEFQELEIPGRFISRSVPIRDGIISILAKKTASDLETTKGRDTLKSEIKNFINEFIRREDVKRVYFTQFVIQ